VVQILKDTFNQQELATREGQTVALVAIRRHDHIGDASLIVHRQRDEFLCRAWALPGKHAPCGPHKLSIAYIKRFV
jgi:hypothetical protein